MAKKKTRKEIKKESGAKIEIVGILLIFYILLTFYNYHILLWLYSSKFNI